MVFGCKGRELIDAGEKLNPVLNTCPDLNHEKTKGKIRAEVYEKVPDFPRALLSKGDSRVELIPGVERFGWFLTVCVVA